MLMRPVCLLGEQNYCPGGNREPRVKVLGLGRVKCKEQAKFWPLVVLQKLPTPSLGDLIQPVRRKVLLMLPVCSESQRWSAPTNPTEVFGLRIGSLWLV